MTKYLRSFMDWLSAWLGKLPSTNARIAVSLGLTVATGVKVLFTWTAPPWEWLAFLGAMMGLDVLQFGVKRVTQTKPNGFPDSDGTAGNGIG